jgi:hypothetical protein
MESGRRRRETLIVPAGRSTPRMGIFSFIQRTGKRVKGVEPRQGKGQ